MGNNQPPSTPTIARAAGTVMLAFLFSQLAGLAAKILIGRTFNQTEVDAFLAANRPSEALVFIMTGGIFVSSFIPVFVKFLIKNDNKSAWQLASAVANLILIIMTLASGLIALLASPIVKYALTAWFPLSKQVLTIDLLRIQAISVVFFSLSGLIIGILNSHQKFLLSALAPAMYQLGQIFGVLVLAPQIGIYGLAWGVVIGSILNLLIQIPGLLKLKGRYLPILGFHNPAVREVVKLMAPRIFGAAVVQLMVWINTLLASRYEGAVYALSYGFSLMMMAQVAIAQSVATAVMPTFSTQYAQGKGNEMRSTLASVLRAELLLAIPASGGLIALSKPIVSFLYQRGEFTAVTTQMVAWALIWYAAGLTFHSIQEVLVRVYYAMHDTRTPVIIGASAMVMSIGFSILFSYIFRTWGWMAHGGLAFAISLSTALEVTALLLIMRKRLNGIEGNTVSRTAGSAALGSLIMISALVLWIQLTKTTFPAVIALGGIVIGVVIYILVLLVLRVPEIMGLLGKIQSRLSH